MRKLSLNYQYSLHRSLYSFALYNIFISIVHIWRRTKGRLDDYVCMKFRFLNGHLHCDEKMLNNKDFVFDDLQAIIWWVYHFVFICKTKHCLVWVIEKTYIIVHAGRNKKVYGKYHQFLVDDQDWLNCLFPVNLLLLLL